MWIVTKTGEKMSAKGDVPDQSLTREVGDGTVPGTVQYCTGKKTPGGAGTLPVKAWAGCPQCLFTRATRYTRITQAEI